MELLGSECRQKRRGVRGRLLNPGALRLSVVKNRNQQRRMEQMPVRWVEPRSVVPWKPKEVSSKEEGETNTAKSSKVGS